MASSAAPRPPNVPPNVLWICTDQQRGDTIAALGNRFINTPNLDRLAAQGTACRNAFCQAPICTPSRASFLTGCYASTVRACSNGNRRWAEAAPLVTRLLADAGYCCGLAGKLHLAGAHGRIEPRPRDDGYSVFHWSHDPRDAWPAGHAYREWVAQRGAHLGRTYAELGHMPAELHQTTFCAEQAIDFMETSWSQPWLMSVNIFDPHAPFDPPADYLARYRPDELPGPAFETGDLAAQQLLEGVDFQTPARVPESFDARGKIAAYYAMIELIDHNVGRMLDALERTGQAENTLVIFTSDHGEMLGDHGLLLKGCRFYEGLVRVPLILRWPGRVAAGAATGALVELTDLAPTLLDAAGLAAPAHLAGRSLLPLLRGEAAEHRAAVRCEYYAALRDLRGNRRGWNDTRATMIRDRRYKLAVYHGHPVGELFDLQEDPHEHRNLWNEARYAELRFDLLRQCFDATAGAIDTGPEVTRSF